MRVGYTLKIIIGTATIFKAYAHNGRYRRENLHYLFGKTYSGRFLFIVVRFIRQGEIKIITARDMNTWEKNYFKKRGK